MEARAGRYVREDSFANFADRFWPVGPLQAEAGLIQAPSPAGLAGGRRLPFAA
jgi:hypothetical protein